MSKIIERQPEPGKKMTKQELAKKLESDYEYDSELVQGIFRFLEHPGGTLRFRFKKYARDNYNQYELTDGQRYRLPRMVVKHLNNNVHYMEYKHINGQSGQEGMRGAFNDGRSRYDTPDNMITKKKVHRCEFLPLEFGGDNMDLLRSELITVQAAPIQPSLF